SSPWIRDAPHSEFSMLMRRINSRSSRSIFGRPALLRDFHRQKVLTPARCANEGLFQAERPGPRQAGSATVRPSKPATLGHCRTIECEEASAVTPNSTDNGERGSRLQADYAT